MTKPTLWLTIDRENGVWMWDLEPTYLDGWLISTHNRAWEWTVGVWSDAIDRWAHALVADYEGDGPWLINYETEEVWCYE